jgi:AcrR family transcriptional regulator
MAAAHASNLRSSRRQALSRQAILDAAIALVERDGCDALSMRRLGAALGVEAMALYHHIPSRDELLAGMADRLLEPLNDLDLGSDWRDACLRFATALRAIAVGRPASFRTVGLLPLDTPASLLSVERLLGVLVAAGFSASDALGVYRAVASYARGYALAEATGFTVDAASPGGRRRLRALVRDDFPILRGRANELSALDADAGFERGLRALVQGLSDPT